MKDIYKLKVLLKPLQNKLTIGELIDTIRKFTATILEVTPILRNREVPTQNKQMTYKQFRNEW